MAEDFVALQRPSAVRLLMEQNVAAHHGKLAVAFESHQLATIGRMVASGLGVSAVPALCINQMQELGARCVTLVEPTVERRIGVIASANTSFPLQRKRCLRLCFPIPASGR